MSRQIWFLWLRLAGILTLLAGCELPRPEDIAGDIAQFSPPPAGVAQADMFVRLEPLARQFDVGQITTLQIRLENVTNLTEIDLQLRFNPDLLQVQDADLSMEGIQIQPGDFFDRDFVAENLTDNAQGVINYYAVPATTSGSGLLATITFLARAPGFSELAFTLADLSFAGAPADMPLPRPAQITVNPGAGQPTSTFTPIPGQPITPTPTFTMLPPTDTPIPIIVAVSPTATSTPTPTSTATPTNTPVPPAVEIPPGATTGFCYRVQSGENLFSLGQKFGIDPQFISLANDLYPPGHVYPQKILFMPTQYGSGPNVYLVQPGDTLALIAEQCGLPQDFLAAVNGLGLEANLADIGTLIIPRPPYAPPARYPYGPPHVWPPPCPPGCY